MGKTIDITIKDSNGNTIIDILKKKIVGVNSINKKDMDGETIYSVYGTKECFNIANTSLAEHYASELQWAALNNKQKILRDLRKESIVIAGTPAMLIYEKEYIISQMSYFLIVISIIFSILTIISTFNLVNAKIRDNQKEIGILMGIGFNNKDIIFIYLFSMLCMIMFSFLMTLAIIYLGVHIANLLLQTKPFVNIIFFDVDLLTYLTILLAGLIIAILSLIPLLTLSNKKPIDIIKGK